MDRLDRTSHRHNRMIFHRKVAKKKEENIKNNNFDQKIRSLSFSDDKTSRAMLRHE